MHMSLDGYIARPSGEMDWATMNDDEMGRYLITDLQTTVDGWTLPPDLTKIINLINLN